MSFMRMFDLVATDATGQVGILYSRHGSLPILWRGRWKHLGCRRLANGDVEVLFGNYVTQDDIDWVTGASATSPCDDGSSSSGGGGGGLATYYFSLVDMVGTVGTTDNDELIKVVYTRGAIWNGACFLSCS